MLMSVLLYMLKIVHLKNVKKNLTLSETSVWWYSKASPNPVLNYIGSHPWYVMAA